MEKEFKLDEKISWKNCGDCNGECYDDIEFCETKYIKEFIKRRNKILSKWEKEAILKYRYSIVTLIRYIKKDLDELAGDKFS